MDELVWNYRRISYGGCLGVQKHFPATRPFAPLFLNAHDSHQSSLGCLLRRGRKGTSESGWSKKRAAYCKPSRSDGNVSCNHYPHGNLFLYLYRATGPLTRSSNICSKSFHEKAGECQVYSFISSLFLFFGSSSLILLFSQLFPLSQAASVATLPSALFVERLSLGARWVYLIRYVLLLGSRPLPPCLEGML